MQTPWQRQAATQAEFPKAKILRVREIDVNGLLLAATYLRKVWQMAGEHAPHQHRVLFWGIIGAFIMRGGMIYLGAELISMVVG